MLSLRTLATYIGALSIVLAAFIFVSQTTKPPFLASDEIMIAQTASVSGTRSPDDTPPPSVEQDTVVPLVKDSATASRIENPYPFRPQSFDAIHQQTRAALVNILCIAGSQGILPISGSGVIIDPRGLILTNAHVAQHVLIAESGEANVSCSIRRGSPAHVAWDAEVLYLPPIWVQKNASGIRAARPTGTGEHDYALLRITGPTDGASNTESYPYLPFDIREGIGFPSDMVLAGSYPAEFIGPTGTLFGLQPISSTAPIGELLTFTKNSVDLFTVEGVIGAQGGSSGGPVVNAWGRVIGIITTTSAGITTDERQLRALTLSYINRDIQAQSGMSLATMLGGDIAARAIDFKNLHETDLVRTLLQ